MTEAQFPWEALFYVHVFVSGVRQLCSLLYPVRQLHHVCRVDAEEDVQYFRQLRPGLDPPPPTFFASTLKNLLSIFRQCISLVPSLKALKSTRTSLVTLLYPFPQLLRVRRIPHLALIAGASIGKEQSYTSRDIYGS